MATTESVTLSMAPALAHPVEEMMVRFGATILGDVLLGAETPDDADVTTKPKVREHQLVIEAPHELVLVLPLYFRMQRMAVEVGKAAAA